MQLKLCLQSALSRNNGLLGGIGAPLGGTGTPLGKPVCAVDMCMCVCVYVCVCVCVCVVCVCVCVCVCRGHDFSLCSWREVCSLWKV